jgi:hypothetical protein
MSMPILFDEAQINGLLHEQKTLPRNYTERIQLKTKRGHRERELELSGDSGSEFRLILRQSSFNVLDFSIILSYRPPSTSQFFRLRRYNGKSHEHTNQLERQKFYGFNIHQATERYQDSGLREDAYAEITDRYADFSGALECMIADCAFQISPDSSLSLNLPFGE